MFPQFSLVGREGQVEHVVMRFLVSTLHNLHRRFKDSRFPRDASNDSEVVASSYGEKIVAIHRQRCCIDPKTAFVAAVVVVAEGVAERPSSLLVERLY